MTTEEVIAQEMALGASADEAEWTAARLQERYVKKGLLWGRAASEAYPQGEYGSTPASDTVRITQEEYEAAELREWKS